MEKAVGFVNPSNENYGGVTLVPIRCAHRCTHVPMSQKRSEGRDRSRRHRNEKCSPGHLPFLTLRVGCWALRGHENQQSAGCERSINPQA